MKPSEWTQFEPKLCDTCWAACCHGLAVEVSVPDLIRLNLLTSIEASTELTTAARRIKNQGLIKSFTPRHLTFVLEQKPNGDCIFLGSDRRCKVYEKRPQICREFPKIGPRPGFCPYGTKKP